jgi:methylmalonyl-CoA/ethylmalonyl-CoA epimerase
LIVPMHIHHLGVAAGNAEACEQFIRKVHVVTEVRGPVMDPRLKATVRLLQVASGPAIEIVSGEAVAGLLEKNILLYHTCYETPDLRLAVASMRDAGAMTVIPPTPAILFDGRLVSFLLTPLGLIEILESEA